MNIVYKPVDRTADISGARGTAFKELRRLLLFMALLVTGLYLLIGILVDLAVARIPFETEARIFAALRPGEIGLERDAAGLERVQPVLDRLVSDSLVPSLPYHLALVDSPEPNAFAFPGGMIGVSTGLLVALTDDVELAFVLAHELGHFHNRDHLRGAGRALGFNLVLTGISGNSPGSTTLGNLGHHVLSRSYSRHQEEEADRFGIVLVQRVYGRTEGVERLFQLLQDTGTLPAWAYMFTTHPAPQQRIRDLEAYSRQGMNGGLRIP